MNAKNTARAVAAELRAELGTAPTPEELVSYQQGELDDDARRRVRAYLALSPEAAQTVLELEGLPDAADDGVYDVEASWQRLQASLEPQAVISSAQATATSPAPRRWLLAAMLAVALGAGFLMGRLSQEPQPRTQFAAATLSAETTRDGSAPARIEIPSGTEEVALALIDPGNGGQPFDSWLVELRRQPDLDKVLFRKDAWQVAEGYVLLSLPPAMVPSGRYELRLLNRAAGDSSEVARYTFEVVAVP